MTTFDAQIKAFADKAKARIHSVVRRIVFSVSARLMEKSPVGDPTYWLQKNSDGSYSYLDDDKIPAGYVGGRFRGNWQYGNGLIPFGVLDNIDADGSATLAAINAEIPFEAGGRHHFIVNNLPYAQRLERGWSRQAPHGMVGLTVLEFLPIVAAATRAIQNERRAA